MMILEMFWDGVGCCFDDLEDLVDCLEDLDDYEVDLESWFS
jgi:hypothetical protein